MATLSGWTALHITTNKAGVGKMKTCIHCDSPADGVDGKCEFHSTDDLNMSMLDTIIAQHRALAKSAQTAKAPVDVFDLGRKGNDDE